MKKITVLEKESELKTAAGAVIESFDTDFNALLEKYSAYAKDNLSESAAKQVEERLNEAKALFEKK